MATLDTARAVAGDQRPNLAFESPRGRWTLLATVLGSGMAMLDGTVVNVALPVIGRDLGARVDGLQWTISGYLLTLSALILLGGSLGDRFGRRRMFTIGVVWFAASSALCGLAPSIDLLLAARVLQGVGGALLTPGSLAIIQATFAPADRGRAIGAWSALGSVAVAVGPFLGGWLVQAASWRLIFLINLPLAALVVIVTTRHVPETADPDAPRSLDLVGAVLAVLALGGLSFALIEAPELGPSAPAVLAGALIGVVSLVAFIQVEARSPRPMLPLSLFRSRVFTGTNALTLAVYGALSGVLFLLVVQLQVVVGYTPLQSGLATLPITILLFLLSTPAGALSSRIGPRVPLTVGPLAAGAGIALLARVGPGSAYIVDVLPALVVFGLGMSLTVAPLTATVMAAVSERRAGLASAVNNAVARAAGLLTVALLPWLANISGEAYLDPQLFSAGFARAALMAGGLAGLGGLIGWASVPAGRPEPVS